jgi:hypothetical protein
MAKATRVIVFGAMFPGINLSKNSAKGDHRYL